MSKASKQGGKYVKVLVYSAICVALALVLSRIKLFQMPQGGDVTLCSMFFITLVGYWFGPVVGITAGVAEGLLRFVISSSPAVHPVQPLLDYIFAFGMLGLAGFFRKMRGGLIIGYIVGCFGTFFMSFLSGFIFFASYAGSMNPVLYSALYNASWAVPEMIITVIVLLIPQFRAAIDRVGKTV